MLSESEDSGLYGRERQQPKWVLLKGIPRRYTVVLLTFVCTNVCYVERIGFSVAYTAAANAAGVKQATKGFVLSAFYYGYATSQVPGGWFAQKVGGRIVLLISFILWSITCALTPIEADKVGGLIWARLIVGVAQGCIFPSIHTVLAQWVPPHERSRSVSLTTSGMYFGAAFGMLILPGLVQKEGPRAVFLYEAAMGASWALLWFLCASDPPLSELPKASASGFGTATGYEKGKAPHFTLSVDERETGKRSAQSKSDIEAIPWRKLMQSLPVWAIVVNNFTFHYALYVLMNWLPTYFDQGLHVGLENMGMAKMLPYLVMFVFSNVGGVVADHLISRQSISVTYTRKLLNSLGFAIAAVALLVMPHLKSVTGAILCSSISLGSCAFARAGFAVNHMDIAPKYAGILMGISNTAGTIAGVVGVSVTGRILETSSLGPSDPSSWMMVFATPAILCILSALFFFAFATGKRIFN
ncbi:hypothetical protein O6H91_11G043300 [Diphasiastrum complanatum]|uniref:Uncharacterized protein n=1 Tax=Diphasiastrum complanatum TaxID=34168 RepID=A0ACC2C8F7_DIPCM|nr:hypothetical protein O6H91_11G043300 [Diphasiastrum complanatum]